MARIAKVLKTDVMGDLNALAQVLQSHGRGKDTILAHITPAEAKRLKAAGGRGSRNPKTGLLEFDDTPAPADVLSLPETTVSAPAQAPTQDISIPMTADQPSGGASAPVGGDYSGIPYTPAAGGGAQGGAPSGQPYSIPNTLTPPDLSAQPLNLDPNVQAQLLQPDAQPTEAAPQQNALQKFLNQFSTKDMVRLGLGGAGALLGGINARKASNQIAAAQQEQQAMATPYQEAGRAMTGAATRGELTPASAQAYQAARAQMQQQAAARGGVGVEQQAAQLEAFRQQLLQQQYTYGLQVAQIGDNIALGAIRTGLQLDQALNASTQNFYTNLAAIVAGGFGGQKQQTVQ